jgi:hypothetical protein
MLQGTAFVQNGSASAAQLLLPPGDGNQSLALHLSGAQLVYNFQQSVAGLAVDVQLVLHANVTAQVGSGGS